MAVKVAGELYESVTGQLFEIGRQLRQPNGYPFDPEQLKNFLQLAVEGKFNGIAASAVRSPTLVLHKTTPLGEVQAKKTDKCFTGKQWAYRDGDIDRWLPGQQSAQAACSVGVYQLQNSKGTTFREMAVAALKVGPGTSLDLLAKKAIKEQGFIFTLSAIESMVDRQEGGEDVGLLTNGYANFFFVEDSDGSVSVLRVHRDGGRWRAYVYRLGDGDRWPAEDRLLLRNSDTPTL
ncbi:MAG: hypothetical protein AAB919_01525 [Patescibacteria group bacterium]